jgi:LmbE family N-acetylglucosaminyl deacetylase
VSDNRRRRARRIATLALVAPLTLAPLLAAQRGERRVLVAVFAHPDDEIVVGPMLARYARGGIDVRLVLATNGEKGTRITRIPAGDALGRARAREAICSAERLGISRPILLDLGDGTLGVAANTRRLHGETVRVLKELDPFAVITWGGEGLDGHPDHRIVGAVVTAVLQGWADGDPPALYYPGFPPDRAAAVPESPFAQAPTLDRFLTVRIPVEPQDIDAAGLAFACHETQYTPVERERGFAQLVRLLNGYVYLRPAFARDAPRADIMP